MTLRAHPWLGSASSPSHWRCRSPSERRRLRSPPGRPRGQAAAPAQRPSCPRARRRLVPRPQSVTLSWTAATFPSGAAVAGYEIERLNAANGTPATVGAGCSGVVSATTCTEISVPAGSWVYTVTPVQKNWTGATSPDSSLLTVP